jgi:cytochrome c-type biogenesis protein CcmH
MRLAPSNPKALLYGGFAAAVRGDKATARARWEALKALNPPPQIAQMLDERLAELGPVGAAASAPGAALAAGVAPTGAATAGASSGAAGAEATVNISLAPALKARLTQETPLFVFAQEPGVRGPPLAAKRLTTAAIGTRIQLSAADSMIPGRVLQTGRKVSITARVSFSGQPIPAPGDLYGELIYDVGQDGTRDLVIDKVAP